MLLSALGIFFVVDMHAGSPFGIFNSIFNYESFFMQMFVFISGYFFKEKNLQTPFKYIWKNTVKLMIPFFVINAVYTGLIMLAKLYQPQITWDCRFSVLNEGRDTVFTLPAWFVPMLYFVIVAYTLLRLVFRAQRIDRLSHEFYLFKRPVRYRAVSVLLTGLSLEPSGDRRHYAVIRVHRLKMLDRRI